MLLHFEWLQQLKRENCFRRQHDILVAGKRRSGCTSSSARCCADGCSLAATCERANQCSGASAATNKDGASFTLSFDRAGYGGCLHGMLLAADINRIQTDFQERSALEVSHALGSNYGASCPGALRNQGLPFYYNRLSHRGRKRLPGLAALGTQRLTETHSNVCAGGNHYRFRLFCFCFAAGRGTGSAASCGLV